MNRRVDPRDRRDWPALADKTIDQAVTAADVEDLGVRRQHLRQTLAKDPGASVEDQGAVSTRKQPHRRCGLRGNQKPREDLGRRVVTGWRYVFGGIRTGFGGARRHAGSIVQRT